MKPDLQRRVQRYGWDKAAPYYENGWEEQLWPAQESLLSAADLQPGQHVLDISCGTGLVTFPMADIVEPIGSVTAVDISKGMIDKARSEKKQKGIDNVSFQQMDAETLEFSDNTFDAAICSLGLMYFPDPEKAIKEMLRVVKPEGKTAALVWGERKNCGWADIFPIMDRRVKSDVCPLFFQLGTGNALAQSFEGAGFTKVSSKRFTSALKFNSDEQACVAAFWGGAVALAYQKFNEEIRDEVNREYLDSIKQFRNGRSYDVPGEFVITKGIKPEKR